MADFPTQNQQALVTYSTPQALGVDFLPPQGGVLARVSAAWPSANLAIFVPFLVNSITTIVKLAMHNGGTAAGNLDVGIYDPGGNRLVSSGTTAQSGTSALQIIDTTDITLYPGLYYMAAAMDGTTGTNVAFNGVGIQYLRSLGVLQAATSFVLPATVTFAAIASNYVPSIVASSRTTI